ncbi:MAG: peptidase domain protein [Verrucomicrobiaceae bacterium]|nr:peptidase domain protein [Verrucomicrobiaceae bacterium]
MLRGMRSLCQTPDFDIREASWSAVASDSATPLCPKLMEYAIVNLRYCCLMLRMLRGAVIPFPGLRKAVWRYRLPLHSMTLRALFCMGLFVISLPPLHGQVTTPQPFLATLSPSAVQTGVATELTINGTDLDGESRLHFSVPDVQCQPRLDDKQKPVAHKFMVTVPAGSICGPCDVRVVGRYGISNPRGVEITSLPVVALPATAKSPDKAFKAALNTVITGVAVKQGSCFVSFDAKKGQRILAVCRPERLDSRLEAVLTLHQDNGRELDRSKADGVLDFTATKDGAFTLKLSDLMFRGETEFPFALTLITGPLIEYVFDGGTAVTLYGRNLPKGSAAVKRFGKILQRVQMPAEEAKPLLAKNPIRAVLFKTETEAAGADMSRPVALKTPTTFTGWFPERGKPRYFTFGAKKGDLFWIEVNCASRGLVADPFLIVEKVGKEANTFLAESNDRAVIATKEEFNSGWADPSYRFEAKEDGSYRIKLRNFFSGEPTEPFELTVQPVGNDFDLVAMPVALPKAKTVTTVDVNAAPLWRGGVAAMKVIALRRSGFHGPIELSAEGLPEGVTFAGGLIREGQNVGYVTFIAAETVKEWAGAVKLHGKSGSMAKSATVVFKVGNTAKESIVTRITDEVVLGISANDAPVLVEAENKVFEAVANSKLSIPLQVKRRADCTEAIKLAALGLNDAAAETDIAAKANNGKLDLDLAKLKLVPGDYQVVLQGTVKFKHKRGDDPKAAAKDLIFLVHSKAISVRVLPVEKKPQSVAKKS